MKAIAVPYLKTLVECVNKMIADGYSEDFTVVGDKLKSLKTEKTYEPSEVTIINFYRFEGETDPQDNSILYVLEAKDGAKGTLVDAYGPYADAQITKFMNEVEQMEKKIKK